MRFCILSLVVAVVVFSFVPAARAATPCPLSTVSPSVTICTPTNGSTVTSPFQVWAGTTDNAYPVTSMKVYLDYVAVYSISGNVVNTSLTAAAGSHHLTVNAWDSSGAVFKTSINFTVGSSSSGSVTVSPSSLTFGSEAVNTTSAPQTVTLANGTGSAISVSTPAITTNFIIASNTCGTSLAANSQCTIGVEFQPGTTGTLNGTLTITDSPDAGSPHSVTLSGAGVSATTCTPNPVSNTVTICTPTNGATVTSPFQVSAAAYDTAYPVTAMKLYLDSVAQLTVNAAQLSTSLSAAAGAHNVTVNAWDSSGAVFKSTSLITVSTTAAAPSVTPSSVTFSTQMVNTTSSAQNVSLNNPTTGALTVGTPTITGDFQISNNGCSTSLAANSSCIIQVIFQPTATGTRTGTLTITDSPDAGSPHAVSLSGMGAYALSASPTSLSFGDQALNISSTPQKVKLTNLGSTTLTLTIGTSAPYAESDDCNGSLNAGATCTATITFTPTTTGQQAGNLSITYNAAGSPLAVPLSGNGVTVSKIAVTPANPSITTNGTKQFTATATYSDNTTGDVSSAASWSSSDTAVATINSQGLATAVAPGSSTIQASYAGVNGSTTLTVVSFAGVLTFHNDNLRTGANTEETVLTPANVNVTNFGKLTSYTVDGRVYAQPLYVPNVNVNGTTRNVVYAVTENDSVYAFDADAVGNGPLWKRSFINSGAGITTIASTATGGSNVSPQIGITGTPVIDNSTGTLYCVAATDENGTYHWRLHALDIASGADKFGGNVDVNASGFIPLYHLQRPGLLLANGNIYFAFGSNGDHNTWHGWVFAYDASTLMQVGVYNATPGGNGGGIWMGAGGLGADANGDVYFETGNGTNNIGTGGSALSDSFIKLNSSAQRIDYFSPYNHSSLDCCDLDMASGGPVLLPDQSGPYPHMLIGGGKTGVLYVINRDNMGQFNGSTNNIIQTLSGALAGGSYSQPAFWNGRMYIAANVDTLKAFVISNGTLPSSANMQTSNSFAFPGSNISISANGTSNGIAWAQNFNSSSSILYAYDANNLGSMLWNSTQNNTRDTVGQGEKFMAPTVANGKVYIGTTSKLIVYGLLQ